MTRRAGTLHGTVQTARRRLSVPTMAAITTACCVVLVLGISLLSHPVAASSEETLGYDARTVIKADPMISLDVESGQGRPGSTGTVSIVARGVQEPGLGAWTIDMHYDQALLRSTDCATPPELLSFCNTALSRNAVRVTGVALPGFTGDVVLAEFTFLCLREEGASDLRLSTDVFHDATIGEPMPIAVSIGQGTFACNWALPSVRLHAGELPFYVGQTTTITATVSGEDNAARAGVGCQFRLGGTRSSETPRTDRVEPSVETNHAVTTELGQATIVLDIGNGASWIEVLVECGGLTATFDADVYESLSTTDSDALSLASVVFHCNIGSFRDPP